MVSATEPAAGDSAAAWALPESPGPPEAQIKHVQLQSTITTLTKILFLLQHTDEKKSLTNSQVVHEATQFGLASLRGRGGGLGRVC